MKWIITSHAAEQLCSRVSKHVTIKQAYGTIERTMASARLHPDRTHTGDEQWIINVYDTDVLVVAKVDHRMRARVAVTVIRRDERFEDLGEEAVAEVVAAYQRVAQALEDPLPGDLPTVQRVQALEARYAREQLRSMRLAEENAVLRQDAKARRVADEVYAAKLRDELAALRHIAQGVAA